MRAGLLDLRYRIEDTVLAAALAAARIAPRAALRAAGRAAGDAAFLLDARHRRVTLENLEAALGGELGSEERLGIARRSWRHFGEVLFDALRIPSLTSEELTHAVVVTGADRFEPARRRGRGILFVTGHYGHWELASIVHRQRTGVPGVVVTRPLDNPHLERRLSALRSVSGTSQIPKHNAARAIVRALREGIDVGILIDQDARKSGVFVPFFGRPASTTPIVATLALRTGAAIVPLFCEPTSDGGYLLEYEPEVEVRSSGDAAADVVRLTAVCTEILERRIRTRPELWLWAHRRWKTRPPADLGYTAPSRSETP